MAWAAGGADYPHGVTHHGGVTMAATLERLGSKFDVKPLADGSPFVQPASVFYELDGKTRRWDVIKAHSSVAVVLYHTSLDAFLVVRQFRPAVYAARLREAAEAGLPPPDRRAGFTVELCAGIIDKAGKSLQEVVAEEVHEEAGYLIAPRDAHPLGVAVAAAGNNGALSHQFYAAVDDARRDAAAGGGLANSGEAIEVLAVPFGAVDALVRDPQIPKSTGLMLGLTWAKHALLSGEWPARRAADGGELLLKAVAPA